MASFNQFFPSEAKDGPTAGEALSTGTLANLNGEVYAFTGSSRNAVTNDITVNPTEWQLLSGVSRIAGSNLRQETQFWSGTDAEYQDIVTAGLIDDNTIYWITDN